MRKADCLHSHVNMVATIKSKRFYDPVWPTLHIFFLKFPMKTLKAVDKFKHPLPSIAVISARGTVAGRTHRWHLLGLPDFFYLFILCSLFRSVSFHSPKSFLLDCLGPAEVQYKLSFRRNQHQLASSENISSLLPFGQTKVSIFAHKTKASSVRDAPENPGLHIWLCMGKNRAWGSLPARTWLDIVQQQQQC